MGKRLHDGPDNDYIILGGKINRPSKKKPCASLAALQWAADQAGQSYGTFTLHLTAQDEIHIQREYEKTRRKLNVEMEKRAKEKRKRW